MKRFISPLITIGLSLILALFSAAVSYSASSESQMSFNNSAFLMQVTPAPQTEDASVMGNTDQIVIMGGVISLIIVVPILIKRDSWR